MKDYKPKVVLARLKTGGKTVEQIRDELKGQGFTWNQFKHMKESYDLFDGLELYLSLWAYDGHSAWHLYNWKPEDDERVMNAIYHAEQFNPFPAYLKDYENLWQTGRRKHMTQGACSRFRWMQRKFWKYYRRRKTTLTMRKCERQSTRRRKKVTSAAGVGEQQRKIASTIKEDEYYLDAAVEGRRPSEMMNAGIMVPFWYCVWWHHTHGCNNWRRRNALPMIKRYRGRKTRWF